MSSIFKSIYEKVIFPLRIIFIWLPCIILLATLSKYKTDPFVFHNGHFIIVGIYMAFSTFKSHYYWKQSGNIFLLGLMDDSLILLSSIYLPEDYLIGVIINLLYGFLSLWLWNLISTMMNTSNKQNEGFKGELVSFIDQLSKGNEKLTKPAGKVISGISEIFTAMNNNKE